MTPAVLLSLLSIGAASCAVITLINAFLSINYICAKGIPSGQISFSFFQFLFEQGGIQL